MKPSQGLTVSEAGRRGARATLRKYGKRQLRDWGKLGGRPRRKSTLKGKGGPSSWMKKT